MQPEQQKEFLCLTTEALNELNSAPESGSYIQVFSFWRLPAFHNPTRTTLYIPREPKREYQPLITLTTWKRDVDQGKLRDPVEKLRHPQVLKPTFEEVSGMLALESTASIITELSRISLPSIRPREGIVGTDGARFRFAFSQGFYSLDFSWWIVTPQCWQEPTKRIELLVSKLESDVWPGD